MPKNKTKAPAKKPAAISHPHAVKEASPEVIQADLLPLAEDITALILDPRNAREHPEENVDQIKLSLMVYGQCKPVVVNKKTGIIEAGNGMVIAARELGWKRLAVTRADHDAVQAMAYGIMDNKSGLSSVWNMPALKNNLQELDTGQIPMAWTGFTEGEIEQLMTQVPPETPVPGREDDDRVPPPPEKAVTQPGDIWQLGDHRLICGDCTDAKVLKRLLDGAAADIVFTDPPYGIDLVKGSCHVGGGSKDVASQQFRPVLGDDRKWDLSFLLPLAPHVLIWGGNFYSAQLPPGGIWLVWDKQRQGDHSFSDCELIWTNIKGVVVKKYEFMWDGFRRAGSRLEECQSRVHPNQKAVAVLSQILQDYGNPGDLILDPFGGSGSTMIACEKTSRRCYMAELDALYCDVITSRWESFTGLQAKLLEPSHS